MLSRHHLHIYVLLVYPEHPGWGDWLILFVIELNNFLINAFNGQWVKVKEATPAPVTKRGMDKYREALANCVECVEM